MEFRIKVKLEKIIQQILAWVMVQVMKWVAKHPVRAAS